jgi:hypothetical protein
MNKNLIIAAAVAAALGASAAANADSCSAPTYKLYVAGSSAAKASFQTALANDLFVANSEVSYSSSNGDFEAFCGPVKSGNGAGLTALATAIAFYRAEGGSVVGALPIVSGKAIKFLDLTGSGCNVAASPTVTGVPTTTGSSATVGTTDGWGGCVTTHGVEMGVTDLEPTVFYASAGNYPTAYSTSVFGTANTTQLGALTIAPLFSQVFGIAVNTSGINGGSTGQAVNLSKETVANILNGSYTDWSAVPSASGGAVSNVSAPITIINREAGSGTRTGASIYFLGDECTTFPATLSDPGPVDYYATSDELKAAGTVPGSISYASIDNLEPNGTKYPNLTMASLSGVTPSNLAAATGQYDYWFEATAVQGNTTGTTGGITSNGGSALYTWLTTGELQNLATAPHAADINVIPNLDANGASVPLTSSVVGGHTIYLNPFTRSTNSCNIPAEQN